MEYTRIIVVQVDRVGYLCSSCNRFHRHRDPLYHVHLHRAVEGLTFYTDTAVFGIDEASGDVRRLPAALAAALPMEGCG